MLVSSSEAKYLKPQAKLSPPARAAVGVGQLTWNTNLQADAQKWADNLASSGQGLQHDPNAGEGENLFWASPPGATMLTSATQDWLGEKTQYLADHGGGFTEATGHYTQVCSFIPPWVPESDHENSVSGTTPRMLASRRTAALLSLVILRKVM